MSIGCVVLTAKACALHNEHFGRGGLAVEEDCQAKRAPDRIRQLMVKKKAVCACPPSSRIRGHYDIASGIASRDRRYVGPSRRKGSERVP
jgi:hypothetical protein